MRRIAWIALVLWIFAFWAPPYANAQRRVALVIGNGAYSGVTPLPNPTRDAAALENLLLASGFDVVRRLENARLIEMRRALRDFSAEVAGAEIAMVYFAGHGIEVNGSNYLIPIDAILERDIDVEDEALPLERVSQILEPAKRLRLVVLDACRDNPFVRSMKRSQVGRSVGRGLAKVEVLTSDTLVAYAAKAGSTASDGSGTNSPYTLALLNHLATPGLDVRLAFGRVRDEVLKTTRNTQEPFVYGSLGGAEISLVPAKAPEIAKPAATAKPAAADVPQRLSEAAEAWSATKDATSIAVLEAFVARYKGTFYAELAQARIDELKRQQAAAKSEAEAARKKAEDDARAKVDAEQRQRLAMLQQEEDRKRAGAESAKALPGGDPLALTRSLQAELKRVGCDPGAIDGVWGVGAREALAEFIRLAKLSLPAEPSAAALDAVSSHKKRVCPLRCEADERMVDGRCVAKARPVQNAPTKSTNNADDAPKNKGNNCWANNLRWGANGQTGAFCN
jgi:uncharacterized caspase-like protein